MSDSSPGNIGSFRILSKLGQGGMGSVYRAVQGTLERPVALKVLPPEFSSHAEYVARFLREARTIAAIRHENIIQVYDSGEFNGQYYIAMELVDGGNLLNIADARQKVAEADGLRMMLQAAKGLNAAHAKGLIHRDIKPENLLLGMDGVLRIVDFGLVMDSGSATQLTLAGTCLGTPMYMSPEQADGETADPRSDLYALGATFFRVFTGRPPFGSATVMNILYKQKFEKPPDPQFLRPDLSRGAADLLLHLLAKRRDDRPEGATTLIGMIEAVLAGNSIPAPPPFAPLIPKPRPEGEELEPCVSSDGESAALFGSHARRNGWNSGGRSWRVAAAILGVICAAGLIAYASSGKQVPQPPKISETLLPQISDAELRERTALGDDAFKAGRIKDARAIYLDALKFAPTHVELIARRDRTDRRIVFDNEMRAAADLEKQGKLNDALSRYRNAQALDEENAAQTCIDRVAAAIETAKKPLAEFSPAPPRDPNAVELERLETQAADAQQRSEFDKVESAYARAAEIAPEARKAGFAEKARQCRRLAFLAQARAAEGRGELSRAETAYRKAQEIASDAATAERLDAVVQKITAEEKAEARYQDVMREGQDAIDKGEFVKARIKFGVAMELKPGFSPPVSKLNEAEGRETLAKGDSARDAGDLAEAQRLYASAMIKSSALESDAQLRIKALDKVPSRAAKAVAKACELAEQRKDDEAAAVLDEALKLDPAGTLLKNAKTALEAARAAEDVIEQMQKIEADAMERFKIGAELDEDDAATKRHTLAIAKMQLSALEKSKKPLAAFAANDFAATAASLAAARSDATELEAELQKAAEHYTKQAEKSVGLKVPFIPKIGVGGDRKKSDKYHSLADGLTQLVGQAKLLQKP